MAFTCVFLAINVSLSIAVDGSCEAQLMEKKVFLLPAVVRTPGEARVCIHSRLQTGTMKNRLTIYFAGEQTHKNNVF